MRFDFFEKLSREEAQSFLERFLAIESDKFVKLEEECSTLGIPTDFTIKSVAPFMKWIVTKLETVRKDSDVQLPKWVRDTKSYSENLFDFDELSKCLILCAAYYLGESFVRSHDSLHWTLGNPETAEANMPVVAGFASGRELAPILIAENLFGRVVAQPAKIMDIDNAVEFWSNKV